MPLKNILNAISTGLDVIGMIPVVGNVASLLNVGVSLARGDLLGAGLNLLGVIPGVGQAVKGVKLLKNLKNLKYLRNLKNAVSSGLNAIKTLKAAAFQKIVVGARGGLSKIKAGISRIASRFKNWRGGAGKPFVDNPLDEAGKLKPDVTYKAGEFDYIYETDSIGRLEKFTTEDLKLTERAERLPHDANTPGKMDGDHAGHLAGDRFGGSPEIDNLVSQSSNVNLSTYKKLENKWAKAIEQGKPVKVEVNIKYDGNSLRPIEFNVKYSIDGVEKIVDISN